MSCLKIYWRGIFCIVILLASGGWNMVVEAQNVFTVTAGPEKVVALGEKVVLEATTVNAPPGATIIYHWKQLAGPLVQLTDENTSHPFFTTGQSEEHYVFAVTAQSVNASATDVVTLVSSDKQAPFGSSLASRVNRSQQERQGALVLFGLSIIRPFDRALFILAVVVMAVTIISRLRVLWRTKNPSEKRSWFRRHQMSDQGKVVHYQTGEPIADVEVLIYDQDNKLSARQRTNAHGTFSTLLPPGEYTIGVEAIGFMMTPNASLAVKPEKGILYTGGRLTVRQMDETVPVTVAMKPVVSEISPAFGWLLRIWQLSQRWSQRLAFPCLLGGFTLHTLILFFEPTISVGVIEVAYVVLLFARTLFRIHLSPAYGLVRDALTRVPIDLAVVRIFTEQYRLALTDVTDTQGKFFAVPPAGTYVVTVSKPGYLPFSQTDLTVPDTPDATLRFVADLMPVARA